MIREYNNDGSRYINKLSESEKSEVKAILDRLCEIFEADCGVGVVAADPTTVSLDGKADLIIKMYNATVPDTIVDISKENRFHF